MYTGVQPAGPGLMAQFFFFVVDNNAKVLLESSVGNGILSGLTGQATILYKDFEWVDSEGGDQVTQRKIRPSAVYNNAD